MGRIEDYALIGDCHSAALVGQDGTIDWLPAALTIRPASPPPRFWALGKNGLWRDRAPSAPFSRHLPALLGDTLVLETLFETADGAVALIDFMTVEPSTVIRIVEGRRGSVACHLELVIRFDYGMTIPWVTRLHSGHGITRAVCGPEMMHRVRADVPLHTGDLTTVSPTSTVSEVSASGSAGGIPHRICPRLIFRTSGGLLIDAGRWAWSIVRPIKGDGANMQVVADAEGAHPPSHRRDQHAAATTCC